MGGKSIQRAVFLYRPLVRMRGDDEDEHDTEILPHEKK